MVERGVETGWRRGGKGSPQRRFNIAQPLEQFVLLKFPDMLGVTEWDEGIEPIALNIHFFKASAR